MLHEHESLPAFSIDEVAILLGQNPAAAQRMAGRERVMQARAMLEAERSHPPAREGEGEKQ